MPGGEREDERCKQIHKTNKIEILTINLNRCRMPQDLGVHKMAASRKDTCMSLCSL